MSRIKWYRWGNIVYPQCPRCGAYPLQPRGKDEYGNYLEQCGACGRVYAHKTPLPILRARGKTRW